MAHETRLEQHHHILVETDPLGINITTSQSTITPYSGQGRRLYYNIRGRHPSYTPQRRKERGCHRSLRSSKP